MAYRLQYSDYVTSEGPPDPAAWVGPPGPVGPAGPPGAPGEVSKAYVDAQDAVLQQAIEMVAQNLVFVGQCHVPTDSTLFTVASGILPSPGALPPAASTPKGYYVIVVTAGSPPGGSNIPAGSYALHDWIICDGAAWVHLQLGMSSYVASDIAITPPIGSLGANVQTGLQWINDQGYQTAAQVASVLPVASSTNPAMDGTVAIGALTTYARADHVHASDTSRYAATNPAGYQTAANVTTALSPYATTVSVQAALRYLNYADNSGFSVNQRTYVSGAALAAAAFGHDRWKGGAGGCTYTFAAPAGPANTITITAGTLQQVIEGASIAGGSYMLSWTGSAQGRVGAGAYAASPVAVTGIVAGANTTLEFNAGTLGRVKFEVGTVVTPWVARTVADELGACQRYYQTGPWLINTYASAAGGGWQVMSAMPVQMRALPAVSLVGAPTYTNSSGAALAGWGPANFAVTVTGTAIGVVFAFGTFAATADI